MIIGITGLIGSGKDTIADYLTTHHGFKRISFAASLKDAVSVVCELSMGKFSQCVTNAVSAMTLLANLFEGSQDVQWSQCLVRSGAHRAAQAHIIAYGDHPVLIRAVGRMCTCICFDSACATLLRDLDLQ